MSKPSFLTESLGRRFLSIAVVSFLTLIIAVSGLAASQENGAGDRHAAFRRLVQSYVQIGKAEYDKGHFAQAEKTFLMTKPYREYLTPAAREQLDTLLNKTQTAVAERKRALEAFPAVNNLIITVVMVTSFQMSLRIEKSFHLFIEQRNLRLQMKTKIKPLQARPGRASITSDPSDPAAP